jgi:uncharacterized phage protein (TIGR01671 family)
MNREIKFRAWNNVWKCMYYLIGFKLAGKKHTQLYYFDADGDSTTCAVLTENIVLLQYTGLHDKNGKEIYEGDIVQFNNNKVDLCQVCFGEFPVYDMETEEVTDTTCGWYAKVIFTDALSQIEPFNYDRVINNQWIGTLDIEVIGNIYENPELLNQPTTVSE